MRLPEVLKPATAFSPAVLWLFVQFIAAIRFSLIFGTSFLQEMSEQKNLCRSLFFKLAKITQQGKLKTAADRDFSGRARSIA